MGQMNNGQPDEYNWFHRSNNTHKDKDKVELNVVYHPIIFERNKLISTWMTCDTNIKLSPVNIIYFSSGKNYEVSDKMVPGCSDWILLQISQELCEIMNLQNFGFCDLVILNQGQSHFKRWLHVKKVFKQSMYKIICLESLCVMSFV